MKLRFYQALKIVIVKEKLRSASPKDLWYLCFVASSINIMNYHAFLSKSTRIHNVTYVSVVKVFAKEHAVGLTGGVHSDSKKEVNYFKNYISCFVILTTTKMQ